MFALADTGCAEYFTAQSHAASRGEQGRHRGFIGTGVFTKSYLRRIGSAAAMGVMWGAAWAAVGALIATLVDPHQPIDELWLGPAIGVHPGFVGGVAFSALLGIAAPRRRLAELSLSRVGASGGIVGLLLGLLPLAINEPPSESRVWLVGAVVIGSLTVLSALSAAASLALARMATSREVLGDTVRPGDGGAQ